MGPGSLCFRSQRSHRHETLDLESRQGQQFLQMTLQSRRLKPMLAPLPRDIHFQKDTGKDPFLRGNPVDVARQVERINPVDQLEMRQRLADLVGLKMADQMPSELSRQQRDLRQRFLNPVLPEEFLPSLHGLADDFCRMGLGNGNQLDLRGIAAGTISSRGDLFPHRFQIFQN